jgi:hypothetical protein
VHDCVEIRQNIAQHLSEKAGHRTWPDWPSLIILNLVLLMMLFMSSGATLLLTDRERNDLDAPTYQHVALTGP